mgnify:CR=1 FL=1
MAIIKCKMCGGNIEISADKTFGTCEYCGSTMTLPKTDDDQRLSLFNRGTHLRRNGEFDKAASRSTSTRQELCVRRQGGHHRDGQSGLPQPVFAF